MVSRRRRRYLRVVMKEDRMKSETYYRRLRVWLVVPLIAAAAVRAPRAIPADEIQLTVTKTGAPGDVHLSWTGGNPGFTIHRGQVSTFDPGPSTSIGSTLGTAWNDSPPTFNAIFYLISDTRCGPNDTPELAFVDANCDGIDGNIDAAVFVDTVSGNDANTGTPASPRKTIGSAITLAAASVPVKDVYVSKGVYNEIVNLANGVSLYGGYDAAAAWARSASNTTTIATSNPTGALVASNLSSATQAQLFTVTSGAAGGTGVSSIGVIVRGSAGPVTLRALNITSSSGSPGQTPPDGSAGPPGADGASASGSVPGNGGGSGCGPQGGNGAPGVSGATSGFNGGNGWTINGSGPGGFGGQGGFFGACGGVASPANNAVGSGGNGGPGAGGFQASTPVGSLSTGGFYSPTNGGAGGNGFPGGGGGGGGSGAGAAYKSGFLTCSNCNPLSSGGGGGGGGGGCGGQGGFGGTGAGGSFPIVSVGSTLILDLCELHAGAGGTGGNGSSGGAGGIGGAGSVGGQGQSGAVSGCTGGTAGSGAGGAPGGWGGTGGGGGGGTGGSSICVLYKSQAAPSLSSSNCTVGAPGAGGSGGGGNPGQSGRFGITGTVVQAN